MGGIATRNNAAVSLPIEVQRSVVDNKVPYICGENRDECSGAKQMLSVDVVYMQASIYGTCTLYFVREE